MYVGRLVSVLLECFHDDSWPLAVHVHDIVMDWSYYSLLIVYMYINIIIMSMKYVDEH